MAKVLIVDQAEIFLKLERFFPLRAACALHGASGAQEIPRKDRQNRSDPVIFLRTGREKASGSASAGALKEDPAAASTPLRGIRLPGGPDRESPVSCEGLLDHPVSREFLPETASSHLVPGNAVRLQDLDEKSPRPLEGCIAPMEAAA